MSVSRSTISFTEYNWQNLQKSKNKSQIVNSALKFFFDAQKLVKKKEEEFILQELHNYEKTGEVYSFEETFK